MERKNQRISDLFYNNRFLLVFSVVAAIALWLVVAVEYGPEDTNTITVDVDADFEYINKSLNLTCFGDYDKNINVTIKGQRLVVDSDGVEEQISAKLRTDAVTGAGLYPLVITVSKTNDSTSEFEIIGNTGRPYYNLFFDSEMKKDFVIEPDIDFEINNNEYYVFGKDKYRVEPYKVKLIGPATYVSKVDKVVAKAVVKGEIKSNISEYAELELYDAYGNTIDPKSSYITLKFDNNETNVKINVPVYKVQEMKTGYDVTNRPKNYIKSDEDPFKVTLQPSVVKVAVPESSLNASNELEVINIDYSKLHKGINRFEVPTSELEGCVFLDGTEKITVIVDTGNVATSTLMSPDISAVNFEMVPEGRSVNVVKIDFEEVTMVGPSESVDLLRSSDLKIRVDMSSVSSETTGEIRLPAFIESDDCWSYGDGYFVTVNVE